jgi:integrase
MMPAMRKKGCVNPHRGRWRVRVTIDGGQKSLGVYDTKEQADDVLAGALAELGTDPSTTLRGWGRSWLDARERSGLRRDVDADRSRWRCYVETQPWIDEPLDALTSKTVRAWVRSLLARPKARQTVANALNLLRVALEDAVEAELIDTNPARGVLVPKVARTDDPWTYLRPKEITTLLAHPALPAKQRAAFALAIYTGAREGEIFGVHWRDVHLDDEPRITFRFCWRKPRKNGKPLTVPLLTDAAEILRAWRRARPSLPNGLVFPAADGSPHTKGYDGQWADRWRAATGTRDDVRFHDLRHTCGASLISGVWGRAWRLEDVQSFLGHDSRASTERYAHLAPEGVFAAAAATPGSSAAPKKGRR